MFKRLKEKWVGYWQKQRELSRKREEFNLSVNCPYCKQHYTSSQVNEHQQETDLENITAMQCSCCSSIFAIKSRSYHEPTPAHFHFAYKFKNFDPQSKIILPA